MAVSEVAAVLDVPVTNMRAEEMAEVSAVLASPSFQRAAGISQVLRYLSQMYFEGRSHEVKEYSIAVEALGRKPDFDPQSDAIVRVDLYHLRKRLQKYYETEGRSHAIHIQLPVGSYAPEFIHNAINLTEQPEADSLSINGATDADAAQALATELELAFARRRWLPRWRSSWLRILGTNYFLNRALFLLCGIVLGAFAMRLGWLRSESRFAGHLHSFALPASKLIPVNGTVIPGWQPPETVPVSRRKPIRILCGHRAGTYTDSAGNTWLPDQYYDGGEVFTRPVPAIAHTVDPQIYAAGRQDQFQYDIPVPAGEYEVHLLFAETQPGILEDMRDDSFTIAGVREPGKTGVATVAQKLDVVTDAGSPDTATEKIYPHVVPGSDGKIHLNFWTRDAFLNAIEILPEKNGASPPFYLSTQLQAITDAAGTHWLPDQYFSGGRNLDHPFSSTHRGQDTSPVLTRERYGNFNYSIPAAQNASYTVTLWMAERYWGAGNSGLGGIGSRIFDVDCNGVLLLHHFDILRASPTTGIATVVLHHLRANSLGKLNLSFVPVQNAAVVNAIEVQRE